MDQSTLPSSLADSFNELGTNGFLKAPSMKCNGTDAAVNSHSSVRFERQLGDSEISYYLPSRADGVNDMYLHLGFHAPERLVTRERVRLVWAILRNRHPLLESTVEMRDYDDVRFVYSPPESPEDSLILADKNLEYCSLTKDELLESYLNGTRTLSNERLSYLIVSQPGRSDPLHPSAQSPNPTPASAAEQPVLIDYELLICAAHFLGDGMALHTFANDFFGLLGSSKSETDLEAVLKNEFQERRRSITDDVSALPNALEDNFPLSEGKFRRAVGQVDFKRDLAKQIGGHTFPKQTTGTRHTIVPTVPFDPERTKKILKNCKAHGVSISAALFAICNIAWARVSNDGWKLPTMMYSALNLRPYFTVKPKNESYWFLAVGYFNIILPTFLPSPEGTSRMFWHRAHLAKGQSTRVAKNTMVISRCREMARQRAERARLWAKEDDEKERGTWKPSPKPSSEAPRSPSAVLLGLSLLGNLDGIYKHATFPEIQLHTLTTGSRQRQGGMLLFGYTFAGKLWVSLGYDEKGFEKAVVDKFWDNVLGCIDELL